MYKTPSAQGENTVRTTTQSLWHTAMAIPGHYLQWFSKQGKRLQTTLKLSAIVANSRNIQEYVHFKMQDRLSEISD